jgi:hypothetical protein
MVPTIPLLLALVAGVATVVPQALAQERPTPVVVAAVQRSAGLIPAARSGQPWLAYGIERRGKDLAVVVEVAGDGGMVQVGVAGTAAVMLSPDRAKVERGTRLARFAWTVPLAGLELDTQATLRIGIAANWPGGPGGGDWRRERYLHVDGREPSAALSSRPQDWTAINLDELEQRRADLANRITIGLDQPMAGRYSVVIEDVAGRHVRNLVSGQPAAKGALQAEWDGANEDGVLVAPGSYRWRSVHHPGITPEIFNTFCNAGEPGFHDLLSNHNHLVAAAADGERAFLAAPGTEGGYAISAFGRDGRWQRGFNPLLGMGWNAIDLASDGERLYILTDGEGHGMRLDRSKPDWVATVPMTLARYDLATGQVIDYPGKKRWSELETHPMGPGSPVPALRTATSLSGMTWFEGRLYAGSRAAQALLVVDPESGAVVDRIPLPEPGPVATGGGRLVALSNGLPLLIDTKAKSSKPLLGETAAKAAAQLAISALALDDAGTVFIADRTSSTVVAIDRAGAVSRLGTPGGSYAGAWDAKRMVQPSGLAVLGGQLWVAEDRTWPKRAVVWDLATRAVAKEIFGNPNYGGPGAGIDPEDPTHVLGEGAHWRIDPKTGAATPLAILGWQHLQIHWHFTKSGGHTYLIGTGKPNVILRLAADGSGTPVASWGHPRWKIPPAYHEAFDRAFPPDAKGKRPPEAGRTGVLWIDRNGDGAYQAAEYEFTGSDQMSGSYWANDQIDLTLRLPGMVGGKPVRITLAPEGIDSKGVPRWPTLAKAMAGALPLRDVPPLGRPLSGSSSAVSAAGDLLVLSDPMVCWGADGGLRWRFPNRWADVHGSHKAPLPETGVLQGSLFVLGIAPLDDQGEVFIINGNHGRFFAMTTDGMYLDEMFNDTRLARNRDENFIGGECFGGCFTRTADGTWWLQTGGSGYRQYRIEGLDRLVRARGEITVTPAKLQAALRRSELAAAAVPTVEQRAILPLLSKPRRIDGDLGDWSGPPEMAWDQGNGRYRVRARIARDATNLYLGYEVADDTSPWVNNGSDWTLLFKTGDSVDLQLGTDAQAKPGRKDPVPGDLRLLIAPMGEANVAVLYRHRVPGAASPQAFTSPWRSEKVDEVRRLPSAQIALRRGSEGYQVEAAIPLAELGFQPRDGAEYRADVGVIYGDEQGTINLLRNYWSNRSTGLVNDVPGEIMLTPSAWGTLEAVTP